MTVAAKICGLSTPESVDAALEGGASYLGFNFFARSPRCVTPEQAAELARPARERRAEVVAVTVNATDEELASISAALRPAYIQLHGAETPARAAEVRHRTGAKVIRVFQVSAAQDLEAASAFHDAADELMFDTKAPVGAVLPGGNGATFDWTLLTGRLFPRPWFLAGGLTPANVAQAVHVSGAPMVDVSSGVETAPGVKDPALIKAFLEAVRRV